MRRMLIRWVTPLAWRSSNRRLARSIRRFADVEADSGWQALQILYAVDDPRLKAELFEIALEEAAHARMFRKIALEFDPAVEHSWQPQSRESLYSKQRGAAAAVADLVVSEKAVYEEFSDYARATRDQRLISVFARIREDECEHGECADEILNRLTRGPDQTRHELRAARRRRFMRNYLTGSKMIGSVIIGGLLRAAFFAFGWGGRLLGRRRRRTGDFHSSSDASGVNA